MAIARQCDRCYKLYEHYPIGNQPGIWNSIVIQRVDVTASDRVDMRRIDLCPECKNELDNFLRATCKIDARSV